MKQMIVATEAIAICCFMLCFALVETASAQEPAAAERIAAVKQSLAKSQKNIRQYGWTETMVVSFKGEEKSRTQNKCSYGADGKVQKTPIASPQPEEKKEKKGLRGKVVEKKLGEVKEYMKKATALIKTYVPPSPELIQKCKDAGKASVQMIEPNRRALLQLRDYHQAGDLVGIELDLAGNTLSGYRVSSFMESPKDSVNLNVRFASLPDSTVYAADIVLDAKEQNIKVNIQNSDYQKLKP
jgi:hypothetical protein